VNKLESQSRSTELALFNRLYMTHLSSRY